MYSNVWTTRSWFTQNWGSVKTPTNNDIPYYAMQWSGYDITSLAANVSASGAKTVLAFNEPDNTGQANLTAAQAAARTSDSGSMRTQSLISMAVYKQYIHPLAATGHYLVSPAITDGGAPSGIAWLTNFFGNCTGCHVDAIAMHWYTNLCSCFSHGRLIIVLRYGGWIDDLESFVEAGKAFNKPIYLTGT